MAVFGFDFYGLTKYGGRLFIDYGVDPFVAEAISPTQISLTWNEPRGNWDEFLILVNRSGYSVNQDDGTVVLSVTKGRTPERATDDTRGSGWYYYTVFIFNKDNDLWERAAVASALAPGPYRTGDVLWNLVPNYFKKVRDTAAGYNPVTYSINPALYLTPDGTVDNLHLQAFTNIFGWGYDILRSQVDTILWGYSPAKMHVGRLALLSNQLGTDLEQAVPAATSRNLVRNLGLLYRKRGTPDGIAETLALSTGWQVDVMLGPNIMLTEDQANFIHPIIPDWDKTVRYVVNDKVLFQSLNFTALQTAYGPDQAPDITGPNAWWVHNTTVEENVDLVRADTGNIGTWQAYVANTGAPLRTVTSTHIGRGVTHPFDPAILSVNALGIKNTSGSLNDILVRTPPYFTDDSTFDRELTQASVIPVPSAVSTWDPSVSYDVGDLVNFTGMVWQALRSTKRYPGSTDWRKMGYDRRVRLNLSFYTHGKFVGGDTTNLVTPYIAAFNDVGDLLYEVYMNPSQVNDVFYDSMNQMYPFTPVRVTDLGSKTWESMKGLWGVDWEWDGVGFIFPEDADQSYAFFDSGTSDCNIGITFESIGQRTMGIVFRCSDSPTPGADGYSLTDIQNGWVASSKTLFKIVGGVPSLATALTYDVADPFVEGDRLVISASGSDITVFKNGIDIGQVTDAFNSSATKHGVVAL